MRAIYRGDALGNVPRSIMMEKKYMKQVLQFRTVLTVRNFTGASRPRGLSL